MQFWDISLELKQLYSFNALRDSSWLDAKNPDATSAIVLSHLLFVPCTPTAASGLAAGRNEKWAGWCTIAVQVREKNQTQFKRRVLLCAPLCSRICCLCRVCPLPLLGLRRGWCTFAVQVRRRKTKQNTITLDSLKVQCKLLCFCVCAVVSHLLLWACGGPQ